MNLLSAFGGGLFIIPVGLFLGCVWSFYRAYKQWKSGSAGYVTKPDGTTKWEESKEKVPFFSIGATWFGIILLAATIGSIIWMKLEQ